MINSFMNKTMNQLSITHGINYNYAQIKEFYLTKKSFNFVKILLNSQDKKSLHLVLLPQIVSQVQFFQKDFPTPASLINVRSWFGLVNQVAWVYAVSPIMQPFSKLIQTNSQFYWDKNLQSIFQNSKSVLINQVTEGIQTRKEGTAYLLLQKYCQYPNTKALTCCHDRWKLVFAGSWLTHGAEKNYSLTVGESLAIALEPWASANVC